MIAQSIYHGISRFGSRGRKLVLKTLEAYTGGERQRFGDHYGYEGLEILAGAIGTEDIGWRWRRAIELLRVGLHGGAAPSLMIALELEAEANALAADMLVLVARQDACFPFDQLIV